MKIQISNKEFEVVFNYEFVKHVMRKNKWTKFSQYDQFLQQFAFEEADFGPEHLEQFGNLVLLGIQAAAKSDKIYITSRKLLTVNHIVDEFWKDMSLLQRVTEKFIGSQPKANGVVDPASRVGK